MNQIKQLPTIKHLSITDIEEELGISQRTIWRWVSSGKFPKPDLAVGRIRRWKIETIQTWLD